MTEKNEIYRGAALLPKDARATFLSLLYVAFFCGAMFIASLYIPFGWLLQIITIVIASVWINKTLKEGAFSKTYVLYADKLTVITRYGLIEMVTAEYLLSETVFNENCVIYLGKEDSFYPDEKLKTLLKIKITS